MSQKLNTAQRGVLSIAASKFEVNYYDITKCATGRTLSALVDRGLLDKHTYPDGSNAWRITDAGRAAVRAGGTE